MHDEDVTARRARPNFVNVERMPKTLGSVLAVLNCAAVVVVLVALVYGVLLASMSRAFRGRAGSG